VGSTSLFNQTNHHDCDEDLKDIFFAIVIISSEEKLPGAQFWRNQKWEYLTQRLRIDSN